jgi:anti-sigma28 factor (negative regulator of flagellin synthesis)
MDGLRVTLDSESIVNDRSGEVQAPSEYVANLRQLELSIQRADEDIFRLKSDLKTSKEYREKSVAQLRTAIREGTVLPLLEAEDEEEA